MSPEAPRKGTSLSEKDRVLIEAAELRGLSAKEREKFILEMVGMCAFNRVRLVDKLRRKKFIDIPNHDQK